MRHIISIEQRVPDAAHLATYKIFLIATLPLVLPSPSSPFLVGIRQAINKLSRVEVRTSRTADPDAKEEEQKSLRQIFTKQYSPSALRLHAARGYLEGKSVLSSAAW